MSVISAFANQIKRMDLIITQTLMTFHKCVRNKTFKYLRVPHRTNDMNAFMHTVLYVKPHDKYVYCECHSKIFLGNF